MCPPNFEASTPFIHGCLAKYGQKWRTIGPKAGKRTHTAGLLYISGRYDVYVACGAISPFAMAWVKTITVHKPYLLLTLTTLLPLPMSLLTWVMNLGTLNMKTLTMNLTYNLTCMFLLMYSLFYDFLVIFLCPLGLSAGWPGEWSSQAHLPILTACCQFEISPKNHATNC